ncbi:hypothetical protein B296_00042005 [Ensete ventricosum]|uniref:Uncharacterized protein n=1 Tax=Ensete ventricosum TaxID=4639 RepID=A0A426XKJ2_ENSVE|nr:hypothetical protein B296_00042005 [Ensete ventricosum]
MTILYESLLDVTFTLMNSLTPFPGNTVTCLMLGDMWSCIVTQKVKRNMVPIDRWITKCWAGSSRDNQESYRESAVEEETFPGTVCNRSSGVKVAIHHLPSLSIWAIDPASVVCKEPVNGGVVGERDDGGSVRQGASGHKE